MPFDPQSIDRTELRVMIGETEKEEEALYTELGRKVFLSEAAAPGAYAPEAEAIRAVKAKASLYETILTALTAKQVLCTGCGEVLFAGAKFCPVCGRQQPEDGDAAEAAPAEETPEAPVCPTCGKVLREGALFCNGCGTKL